MAENVEPPLTYRGLTPAERRPLIAAALERVHMAHRAKRTIHLFDGQVVDAPDAIGTSATCLISSTCCDSNARDSHARRCERDALLPRCDCVLQGRRFRGARPRLAGSAVGAIEAAARRRLRQLEIVDYHQEERGWRDSSL